MTLIDIVDAHGDHIHINPEYVISVETELFWNNRMECKTIQGSKITFTNRDPIITDFPCIRVLNMLAGNVAPNE